MRHTLVVLLAVAGTGCVKDLLNNTAPRLTRFNDLQITENLERRNGLYTTAALGTDLPISLKVSDPQGHDVQVWFIAPPPGLEWEPDQREGVWHIPEDLPELINLEIVLRDDHPTNPMQHAYIINVGWIGD